MSASTYQVIYSSSVWTDRPVDTIVAISDSDDSWIVFERRSEVSDLAEFRAQDRGMRFYRGFSLDGSVSIQTKGKYQPTAVVGETFIAYVAHGDVARMPPSMSTAVECAAQAIGVYG